MNKKFSSIVAQANAKRITVGITLSFAVTLLAVHYASVSSEYGESANTLPSMAGTLVPEASALSTNIGLDGGLNAPTGAAVTQTDDHAVPVMPQRAETSSGLPDTHATDRASHFEGSTAAGKIAMRPLDVGGNGGARTFQGTSGSVGGGAVSSGGGASSGGAAGAASHSLAKSGTDSNRAGAAKPDKARDSTVVPDAKSSRAAASADGNPSFAPTIQNPVAGASGLDDSASGVSLVNGNSSVGDLGPANDFANGGAAPAFVETTLANQALGLPSEGTLDGNEPAQIATVPEAGSTLLLLGCGIMAVLAHSRRYSFRFGSPW